MKQHLWTEKKSQPMTQLLEQIICASKRIHSELGPGLLENTYKHWLGFELEKKNIQYQLDVPIPTAKGQNQNYIDLLIDKDVILLVKSEDHLTLLDEVQLCSYMKFSKKKQGVIINFAESVLDEGIKVIHTAS